MARQHRKQGYEKVRAYVLKVHEEENRLPTIREARIRCGILAGTMSNYVKLLAAEGYVLPEHYKTGKARKYDLEPMVAWHAEFTTAAGRPPMAAELSQQFGLYPSMSHNYSKILTTQFGLAWSKKPAKDEPALAPPPVDEGAVDEEPESVVRRPRKPHECPLGIRLAIIRDREIVEYRVDGERVARDISEPEAEYRRLDAMHVCVWRAG